MATKSDLKHSIIQTLKHNKDGSYQTQANRKERLLQIAEQIIEGGYKIRHIKQLKYKHVEYLVNHWLKQDLAAGTIKNRMTDLRWIASKYGLEHIIPANNKDLAIPNRQHISNEDKSITVTEDQLTKITDQNIKLSLMLQRDFGLRREEAIKIRINEAVVGNELRLRGSWCKNGRARHIKIECAEQWDTIAQVKAFVGDGASALIPADKSYVQQQYRYDNQLKQAGIKHAHGLRHAYAQNCYQTITGWPCSAKGGPKRVELTPEQQQLDKVARELVSAMLGHNRVDVTGVYLGN